VTPQELDTVLRDWGFELQSVAGSHHVYRHLGGEKLSIPYRRPLKPAYVRLALAAIDRIRNNSDENA
jgi:predicted RNA binding protein YcfA (HicA-like mRNA interferase family)